METENITIDSNFVLQGFILVHEVQIVLFVVFLLIYVLSIITNLLIIYIVKAERHLHRPMYFFLSNFSFLEMLYICVTVPKMLPDFLSEKKTISVVGCFIQLYFFFLFGSTENILLTIISFDRYVAICYPLQYLIIMNESLCRLLVAGAWMVSVIVMMFVIIPVTKLSFCNSHVIDHVFCDFLPLVKIACHDTALSEIIFFFFAGLVILGCFTLIIASYIHIIITILSTSSASGKYNAFTTCTSHFFVVFIYYGTVIFMYVRPSVMITFEADKMISVFYSAVTPLLNPIIYSLRNKEVKEAIKKIFDQSERRRGLNSFFLTDK